MRSIEDRKDVRAMGGVLTIACAATKNADACIRLRRMASSSFGPTKRKLGVSRELFSALYRHNYGRDEPGISMSAVGALMRLYGWAVEARDDLTGIRLSYWDSGFPSWRNWP